MELLWYFLQLPVLNACPQDKPSLSPQPIQLHIYFYTHLFMIRVRAEANFLIASEIVKQTKMK